MKVLFAVNNEKIAETITRKYQEEYKEIISSKTVYYFNAIIKELQKDKTYDRIVISEDLEMFANDNYQAIDKFIFEKMDTISDEATNNLGNDIPIILICTDRRTKNDPLLLRLFSLGLYNVLVGQDRSIQKVCSLMYKPRSKKEAKSYYKVEAEKVNYVSEDKNEVSETELQNILNHYKKIGSNISRCVQSFDSICSQYSDEQLKIIIGVLPVSVKVILEENSDSYRKIMGIKGKKIAGTSQLREKEYVEKEIELGNRLTKPVIIPSVVNTKKVVKVQEKERQEMMEQETSKLEANRIKKSNLEKVKAEAKRKEEARKKAEAEAEARKKEEERIAREKAEAEARRKEEERIAREKAEAEARRKEEERIAREKAEAEARRKEEIEKNSVRVDISDDSVQQEKKKRGRPRKLPIFDDDEIIVTEKRRRGRPRKNTLEDDRPTKEENSQDNIVDLENNNIEDEDVPVINNLKNKTTEKSNDIIEDDNQIKQYDNGEVQTYDEKDMYVDDEEDNLKEDNEDELPGFEDYEEDNYEDEQEEDELDEDEDIYVDDEEDNLEEDNEDELPGVEDYEEDNYEDEQEEDELDEDEDIYVDDEEDNLEEDNEDELPGFEDYEEDNYEDEQKEDELDEDEDIYVDDEEDNLDEYDEDELPGFEDYEEDNYEDEQEEDDLNEDEDIYEDDEEDNLEEDDEDELPGFEDYEEDNYEDEQKEEDLDEDEDIYVDDEEDNLEENDEDELPGFEDYEEDSYEDEQEENEIYDDEDIYEDDEEDNLDEEYEEELSELENENVSQEDGQDKTSSVYSESKQQDLKEQNTNELNANEKDEEIQIKQHDGSFNGINNKNYKYDGDLANSIKDLKETDVEDKLTYNIDTDNLITEEQKIVAFVGTTKNGTSFIVNNLGETLSNKGVKTAILDLTKNKNSYYTYTNSVDELIEKAHDSIEKLRAGIADGIKVNKNLSIYTSLPGEDDGLEDITNIIHTLLENYTVVLFDCDFDTDERYFKVAQEIFLVQTLDILTIQPLTAFLRELKLKDVLDSRKLKIVINKKLKVNSINESKLIGAMSVYKDPAMTYMTKLFDDQLIKYISLPFDSQVYAKYLEGLINCKISSKGYPKNFLDSLNKLSEMVYPTMNNKKTKNKFNDYSKNNKRYNETFSKGINSTLDKMKKKF